MNVSDSKELSVLFAEKLAPGLDPRVVHPRGKPEDMLFGSML